MFHRFIQDSHRYAVLYIIRGTHDGKPIVVRERATNAADAVEKAKAKYPGFEVQMIQVEK